MFTVCRCQDVDPALLRRFDRRVEVPLPDAAGRAAFLRGVLAAPEMEGHGLDLHDVARLVELTEGAFGGADAAAVHTRTVLRCRVCGRWGLAGEGVLLLVLCGHRGACCWSRWVHAVLMACGCHATYHARSRTRAGTSPERQQGTEVRSCGSRAVTVAATNLSPYACWLPYVCRL